LVCAGCAQVVGVINAPALEAMLAMDEAYVCKRCAGRSDIEVVLAAQPADHYAHLISRMVLEQMLAHEPLAVLYA